MLCTGGEDGAKRFFDGNYEWRRRWGKRREASLSSDGEQKKEFGVKQPGGGRRGSTKNKSTPRLKKGPIVMNGLEIGKKGKGYRTKGWGKPWEGLRGERQRLSYRV